MSSICQIMVAESKAIKLDKFEENTVKELQQRIENPLRFYYYFFISLTFFENFTTCKWFNFENTLYLTVLLSVQFFLEAHILYNTFKMLVETIHYFNLIILNLCFRISSYLLTVSFIRNNNVTLLYLLCRTVYL